MKHKILDLSTDEGLTLETSAFNLFTVAKTQLINQTFCLLASGMAKDSKLARN